MMHYLFYGLFLLFSFVYLSIYYIIVFRDGDNAKRKDTVRETGRTKRRRMYKKDTYNERSVIP